MKIGAIVENRAAGGDADRAAEIAHQVEQAGCQFQSIGRQAAQVKVTVGAHREPSGQDRGKPRGSSQFAPAPIMSDRVKFHYAESAKQARPTIISQRKSTYRVQKV